MAVTHHRKKITLKKKTEKLTKERAYQVIGQLFIKSNAHSPHLLDTKITKRYYKIASKDPVRFIEGEFNGGL